MMPCLHITLLWAISCHLSSQLVGASWSGVRELGLLVLRGGAKQGRVMLEVTSLCACECHFPGVRGNVPHSPGTPGLSAAWNLICDLQWP